MTLKNFRDSNTQSPMPIIWPFNEPSGILETLTSQNEEDLNSILNMAQFNTNFDSNVMNSTTLGHSYNTPKEPYINLTSYQMSLSSHNNPASNLYTDDMLSYLRERDSKKQHSGNIIASTNLFKTKVQSDRKQRFDVNQDTAQEFMLKELQECNPQLTDMIKNHKQQMQILHPASNLSGLHLQMQKQQIKINCLQEQVNQQEIFAPLLDGGLCSRRFKQYLYQLRNNKHDNDIAYWKKFVSEYYTAGSKMRWCFSKYENIELHTAGVFCPKSMETWCCELCGLKSGKGLEATYETLPRLFKVKSESGMLDEILHLDSPRSCKVSRGVILEYEKVIQESVYETFRVVHKGKLRIVFGHDLKIMSWTLCIENHDEYLLRTVFSPQINQLDKAVEKYQEFQNRASSRASLQDFRKVCDTFVSASSQILEHMELPLVNDLGYPKRFIRCLQISEVLDNMRDLMTFSQNTKMGPVDRLHIYSQGIMTHNQMKEKEEMELSMAAQNQSIFNEQSCQRFHPNVQPVFVNSPVASAARNRQEPRIVDRSNEPILLGQLFNSYLYNKAFPVSSDNGKTRDQALFDKLIREMVESTSRGKSVQETYADIVQQSNHACHGNAPTTVILSQPSSQLLTTQPEPYMPDQFPEAFQSSAAGFSSIEDFIGAFSGGKTTY